ncbi:hypothetical protein AHiyo4_46660 [Arthrobacter sp. Hiyo4]|nr:hypothetical protein AHiyo4_46660 [Arthrobacter sp. Hiyo4]
MASTALASVASSGPSSGGRRPAARLDVESQPHRQLRHGNADGDQLAKCHRTNMATGSTCLERFPYEVMESEELPLLAQGGPAPTSDSACAIFHLFTWPPTAAMFGAFYNPANNVTPGPSPCRIWSRPRSTQRPREYRDIKRMITSLRPAG